MRILIHGMNFSPEPVGIGKYTGEMARWLAARGHELRVVTTPPCYPEWRVAAGYRAWRYTRETHSVRAEFERAARGALPFSRKLEVFRCPIWVPRTPSGLRRLLHLASFGLSSWPAMLRQLRWRPEAVLLVEPTLFCSFQALLLARLCGASAWLHVQDLEVDAAFELGDFSSSRVRDWAFAFERKLLRSFDRVSTISERMVNHLVRKGVDPSHCVLFPNWVQTAVIHPLNGPSPLRRELGISERSIVALYSGSMGRKQGLELLVDAARRLSGRAGIQFVFCGEGSFRQTLLALTNHLPNIRFLPLQPVERLNDLLNLADIHLLPQRADAGDLVMPSKLTGMLASGRPVVATALPRTQLATVTQGRGLVTPPGDVDACVAAILQLAGNADLRQRLGKAARRYAVDHLDSNQILREFERALLSVCREPVGPSKNEGESRVATEDGSRGAQASSFECSDGLRVAGSQRPPS